MPRTVPVPTGTFAGGQPAQQRAVQAHGEQQHLAGRGNARDQGAGQREERVSEPAAGQGCVDGQDDEQRGEHEIQGWEVDRQAVPG
jgi:hypothetical protein